MAVDKSIIDLQIKELGQFDKFFTKKEINYLPEVIVPGEIIRGLTSGSHDGTTWLIAITTKRLLFLDKGMIYGLKQMEMPLDKISSISYKTGLLFGEIQISTSGGTKKVELIDKKDVSKIAQIISDLLKQSREIPSFPQANGNDVVSQLEKLAVLKEKCIISEQEFVVLKQKILGM
jgi:hypothetical protein